MKSITTPPQSQNADELAETLMANLEAFLEFVRRRTGDEELAADAGQETFMRTMKAESNLENRENLLDWFYRILRNALTDLHRSKVARARAMERFAEELAPPEKSPSEFEAAMWEGVRSLLPTLKHGYVRVIELCYLNGKPQDQAASTLGISRNNLKVRQHRARGQFRTRLEQTCKFCASHGCLDGDCHAIPETTNISETDEHQKHDCCGGKHKHDDFVKSSSQAKYFCSICPDVESDKPGDCSKCGMALEQNPLWNLRLTDGKEDNIPVNSLKMDDLLRVRPGEKIPIDEVIAGARSNVDWSMASSPSMVVNALRLRTASLGK